MVFSFKATIYKVGINPCVDVPSIITAELKAVKGYIPIKGTINKHSFIQTLVAVKNGAYRLFVNGPMLKGSGTKLGDTVLFGIEQDDEARTETFPPAFKKELKANGLMVEFCQLTAGRQKEILRYLNNLKTTASLLRNINKVIAQLKNRGKDNKGFLRTLNK